MTLNEIIKAVDEGKTVHWVSDFYCVVKGNGRYLIKSTSGHSIGLTTADGKTLNEDEQDFYIAPDIPECPRCFNELKVKFILLNNAVEYTVPLEMYQGKLQAKTILGIKPEKKVLEHYTGTRLYCDKCGYTEWITDMEDDSDMFVDFNKFLKQNTGVKVCKKQT